MLFSALVEPRGKKVADVSQHQDRGYQVRWEEGIGLSIHLEEDLLQTSLTGKGRSEMRRGVLREKKKRTRTEGNVGQRLTLLTFSSWADHTPP